jgi:hypothetical protein
LKVGKRFLPLHNYYKHLNKILAEKISGVASMSFLKKGSSSRFIVLSVFLILAFLVSVTAQETFWEALFGTDDEQILNEESTFVLVEIERNDSDYEGYQILDRDDDTFLTEEDLYLTLEEINQHVTDAGTTLTYVQTTYGIQFTLTPITTNTAIKNSVNSVEYHSILPTTRTQLETLAEQINGIQNAIGDLDHTDEQIIPIKEKLQAIDENIYLALWYTGRG